MSSPQNILAKYRAISRAERKKSSDFDELIRTNAWSENAINFPHGSTALCH